MMGRITTELDGIKFTGEYSASPYNIEVIMLEPFGLYVPLQAKILFPEMKFVEIERLAETMLQHYGKTLIEVARSIERYKVILNRYDNDRKPQIEPIDYKPLYKQGFEFLGYDRTEKEWYLRSKYNEAMKLEGLPIIPIRALEIFCNCIEMEGFSHITKPDGSLPTPYLELYCSIAA